MARYDLFRLARSRPSCGAIRHPACASDVFRLPSFVLIALSLYNIYGQTLFRLPGFVSERVSTRFAIVGILGLVLSGLDRVEQWSNRRASAARYWNALMLIAGWFLAVQLVLRAQTHRPVALLAMAQPALDVIKPMEVERLYLWSVWLGLADLPAAVSDLKSPDRQLEVPSGSIRPRLRRQVAFGAPSARASRVGH